MKLPLNQKMILDTATGRWRLVDRINPKLNTSQKLQMRSSKKIKIVRRAP